MEDDRRDGTEDPLGDKTADGQADATSCPLVIRTSCLRKGTASTCTSCADVCPMEAISFAEDDAFPEGIPQIDGGLCLCCDLCCAACPTEAVAPRNMSYSDVRFDIDHIARYYPTAYVTCSETGAKRYSGAVTEVPCLGCITPELWFSCLCRHDEVAVFLPEGQCDGCPCAAGERMMEDAIAQAEAWSGATVGLATDREGMDFSVRQTDDGEFDRRAFIADLGNRLVDSTRKMRESDTMARVKYRGKRLKDRILLGDDAASEVDQRFAEARETGVFRRNGKNMMGRRRMVIDALLENPEPADTTSLLCSVTDPALCTACRACLDACPWGARAFSEGVVTVDPLFCVGCGKCVTACEPGAITVQAISASEALEDDRTAS